MPRSSLLRHRFNAEWGVLISLLVGGVLLTLGHRLNADEGQILTGAWNLFNGQRIYEDFFEFIGPASFAWVGLFFRSLGPSFPAALFASHLLLWVSLWAFHSSSRLLTGHRGAGVAASVVWLLLAATPPFINHNSYSSFLACAFALFILKALGAGRRSHALMAGATGALVFFFLQPKGVAVLLVGGVSLMGRQWLADGDRGTRDGASGLLLSYLVGAAGVAGLGFLVWGLNPVLSLLAVARGNLAMNHLALSYRALLGFLAAGTMVGFLSHREGLLDGRGKFLLLLQAGLWASSAHLPNLWHLLINSFPLVLMAGRLGGLSLSRPLSVVWRRGLVALFFAVALSGVGRTILRNVSSTRVTQTWVRELEEILGGEEFFAFTFLPSFYFELKVPNPYYNSVLYVGSHPVEHFRRNAVLLSEHEPRFILLDYGSVAKYGHTLDNPVDEYIRRHYRPVWHLPYTRGNVEIWERF